MEEEKLQLSNDRLKALNNFIDLNLRNRTKSTNYHLLYDVSKVMTFNLKLGDRHIKEPDKPYSLEETRKIVLDFYSDVDSELYEKVNSIVSGNSKFDFRMYYLKDVDDFSEVDENGFQKHTKGACVDSHNGISVVYVPCKGNINDAYLLAHEVSHTFDLADGLNPTRNVMGEVTPYSFEAMFGNYLVKRGIISEKEAAEREKREIISHYDDGVETFAKLELMEIKERQREIKQEDISKIQEKYKINNGQLDYILERMMKGENNVDYRARYMMAQLVYPHYMEEYERNPKEAVKKFKEYFSRIKDNDFEGSLRALGIDPKMESLSMLIDKDNKRISNIEKVRHQEKNGFEDIE